MLKRQNDLKRNTRKNWQRRSENEKKKNKTSYRKEKGYETQFCSEPANAYIYILFTKPSSASQVLGTLNSKISDVALKHEKLQSLWWPQPKGLGCQTFGPCLIPIFYHWILSWTINTQNTIEMLGRFGFVYQDIFQHIQQMLFDGLRCSKFKSTCSGIYTIQIVFPEMLNSLFLKIDHLRVIDSRLLFWYTVDRWRNQHHLRCPKIKVWNKTNISGILS